MVKEAEKYLQLMDRQYYKSYGKVVKVVGLTIESVGPKARMGDLCKIYPNEKEEEYVIAEVVGFQDSRLILMPVDALWKIPDIPCQFWLEKNCLGIRWMESDA